MLRIQRARPHPALEPFIRSFVQRDAALGSLEVIEPVIARLGVTIEFKFAGLYEIRTYHGNSLVRPNQVSVVGPQTFRRVRLTLSGAIDSIAVIFHPCGFHALFGTPTYLVADTSVEGQAVLGRIVSHLHERLGELRTFSERLTLLNNYFLECSPKKREASPVDEALHQLTVDRYQSLSDAARQAGLSTRQFERKSLIHAGVPPKTLARISRFNSALHLSRSSPLSWAEVAHATEYHDHMHLIRDFRAFAGLTPSRARQEIGRDHLINFSGSYAAASYSGAKAQHRPPA